MKLTRIHDLLEQNKTLYSGMVALAAKENGQWRTYTIEEYAELSESLATGFMALGLKKFDKIITISNNRPEWNFADMAMSMTGIVHIPIYPTLTEDETRFIFEHSEASLVIVSDRPLYNKVKPIADSIDKIIDVYTFNEVENAKNWKEILELGKAKKVEFAAELKELSETIDEHQMATLIYTSGTTGQSKGVMLSHKNLLGNSLLAAKRLHMKHGHKALSFLPLCHVFERMTNYLYQSLGVSVYYAENLAKIGENLQEIKPEGFITVPRLLESVYDKIVAKGKTLKGAKKSIFFWSLKLASRYKQRNRSVWYNLQHKLANKLVYSKWRDALGGNIIFLGIGGAALQPRLERVFNSAGIPIFQGYGLTETSPIIAVNFSFGDSMRFETVGPVLEEVEVKIADDGEILCKGPCNMLGYYKDPEKTADMIDSDGWLHTGDIGQLIDGRFLKITDRKKEIFKTLSGKYIAPQPIENKLKESDFIEQAMVVGENQKFAGALISPNFEFIHKFFSEQGISFETNEHLITYPKVLQRFQQEINRLNKSLGSWEQIKKFKLVLEQWTPQSGELSPTLKLKRNYLKEKYKQLIEHIYSPEKAK